MDFSNYIFSYLQVSLPNLTLMIILHVLPHNAEYFRKKGVPTMKVQELFNFIVDPNITKENRSEYLEKMKELASQRPVGHLTDQEKVDEEVFKNVFIPKTLNQVRGITGVLLLSYFLRGSSGTKTVKLKRL